MKCTVSIATDGWSFIISYHISPEVRAARRWDGGQYLSHAGANNERFVASQQFAIECVSKFHSRSLKKLTTIHPTVMTAGPPVLRPYRKSLCAGQRKAAWSGCLDVPYVVIGVATL